MIQQFIRSLLGLKEPSPQVRKKTWGVNPDCPTCDKRLITTNAASLRMWCNICGQDFQCRHWPVEADYFKKK